MNKELLILKAVKLYPEDKILRNAFLAGAEYISQELGEKLPEQQSLNDYERTIIERALLVCNNNRKEAAKKLGIGERTIYRKIKFYNL